MAVHTSPARSPDVISMDLMSPIESPMLSGVELSSLRTDESRTSLSSLEDGATSGSMEEFGLDGNEADPIVICGFSIKFPQEATSPEGLWKIMMERRCAMTDFPAERVNLNGFHQKDKKLNNVRSSRPEGTPCWEGSVELMDTSYLSGADTSSRTTCPFSTRTSSESHPPKRHRWIRCRDGSSRRPMELLRTVSLQLSPLSSTSRLTKCDDQPECQWRPYLVLQPACTPALSAWTTCSS